MGILRNGLVRGKDLRRMRMHEEVPGQRQWIFSGVQISTS